MSATIKSFTLDGIFARVVHIEVSVQPGLPHFTVIGLPDAVVRETRERVRAALVNSGFEFPLRRIVINLAPASRRTAARQLDLPIAVAILCASDQLELESLRDAAFLGALELDGSTRSTAGVLPIAEAARDLGTPSIVVAAEDGAEAAIVDGIRIVPVGHLGELSRTAAGEIDPPRPEPMPLHVEHPPGAPDLADLRGQPALVHGLEVAAAGGHSLLLMGPPRAGKAMAASRIPSILPPLTTSEALEVARVASASGRVRGTGLRGGRPFRTPHHTISAAALLGGGRPVRPGEVTLAHRGVLLLDGVGEFRREALEGLAEPLASGEVSVARGGSRASFPADFLLIAAATPCPCGPDPGCCTCSSVEVERHRSKVEAALTGSLEIGLSVRPPTTAEIGGPPGESSALIADRVERARHRQEQRLGPGRCNAQMTAVEARRCPLHPDASLMLAELHAESRIAASAHDRLLRVAQTLADLQTCEEIGAEELSEALRLVVGRISQGRPA
jgi:magnesium chelatase family protein